MGDWSRFSIKEIERRRKESVATLRQMEREQFDRWYQEECDRAYWSQGQCCAGCDFWNSEKGWSGECRAAGLVPGEQVLASIGIVSWSGPLVPGYPLTTGDHWCGKFKDGFDWADLENEYLEKIGAMKSGAMLPKPVKRAPEQNGNGT